MRDLIEPPENRRPRQDVQNAAETAALNMGLTVSQAARFAAATLRHLDAGRPQDAIARLLDAPDEIVRLTNLVDHSVETAASNRSVTLPADLTCISASFLEGLPCSVEIDCGADVIKVHLALLDPSRFSSAEPVRVPDALWSRLTEHRPGAASAPPRQGAALMEL